MKRYSFLFLFIAAVISAILPPAYSEQDISLKASVDKENLTAGETLTFTIVLTGSLKSSPSIKLPELKSFEIISRGRSQNLSIIKGESRVSTEFKYLLRPKKGGRLTIGPCELTLEDQTFSTAPIEIEVIEKPESEPLPAPAGGESSEGVIL